MTLTEVRRVLRLAGQAIREEWRLRKTSANGSAVAPSADAVVQPEPAREVEDAGAYLYERCIACCAELGGSFPPAKSLCVKCVAQRQARPRARRRRASEQSGEGSK